MSNSDLERFLTRAVTAFGERVQSDTTEAQLDEYSKAMADMAGEILFRSFVLLIT